MNYSVHMHDQNQIRQFNELNHCNTPENCSIVVFQGQTIQKFELSPLKKSQTVNTILNNNKLNKKIKKENKDFSKNLKKDCNKKGKGNRWSQQSYDQLFCAIIKFHIQTLQNNLSFSKWKQDGFYPYLSNHFSENLKVQDRKSIFQCKSKCQNLKNKHFINGDQPKDLIKLSLQELEKAVTNIQSSLCTFKQQERLVQQQKRLNRYQGVIQQYKKLNVENKPQKEYETILRQMKQFTEKMDSFLKKLLNNL